MVATDAPHWTTVSFGFADNSRLYGRARARVCLFFFSSSLAAWERRSRDRYGPDVERTGQDLADGMGRGREGRRGGRDRHANYTRTRRFRHHSFPPGERGDASGPGATGAALATPGTIDHCGDAFGVTFHRPA